MARSDPARGGGDEKKRLAGGGMHTEGIVTGGSCSVRDPQLDGDGSRGLFGGPQEQLCKKGSNCPTN